MLHHDKSGYSRKPLCARPHVALIKSRVYEKSSFRIDEIKKKNRAPSQARGSRSFHSQKGGPHICCKRQEVRRLDTPPLLRISTRDDPV